MDIVFLPRAHHPALAFLSAGDLMALTHTEQFLGPREREPHPSLVQRLTDASDELARWLSTHAWAPLLGLAMITWLSVTDSAARPFWFDEIFTVHLAGLPTVGDILQALSKGVDAQPPLFHLITRLVQRLFGNGEVATRLPALAGYLLMTVCLYLFVRRRTNSLFGCVAALFPAVTLAFEYSYEARPYGMVLGFSALALWCWQEAATGLHRKLALAGLWLSLSLAVASHYYAVLAFVPIAMGELIRIVQRRRIDLPIAIAGGLAGMVALAHLPLIHGVMASYSEHPWNSVTLRFTYEAFQSILLPAAVPMALSFVALYLMCLVDDTPEPPALCGAGLTAAETGACLGYLLLPACGYLLGRTVTHMMTDRYVLSLVVGLAVLFACAFYNASRGRAIAGLALLVIMGGTFVARNGTRLWKSQQNPYSTFSLPSQNPDLPLVVGSPLYFAPLVHYGNSNVTSRMVYLFDSDLAYRYLGMNATDRNVEIAGPVFRWPVTRYGDFASAHPRFFLFSSPGSNWVEKKLVADGARLELLSSQAESALYLVTQNP